MARISKPDLALLDRYLRPSSVRDMEMRRLIVALREAYQEIDALRARQTAPATPGEPSTVSSNSAYQCGGCGGSFTAGILHICEKPKL